MDNRFFRGVTIVLLVSIGLATFVFLDFSKPSLAQQNSASQLPDWMIYPGAVLLTRDYDYKVCILNKQIAEGLKTDCENRKNSIPPDGSPNGFPGVVDGGSALQATYLTYGETDDQKIIGWYQQKFSSLDLTPSDKYSGNPDTPQLFLFYRKSNTDKVNAFASVQIASGSFPKVSRQLNLTIGKDLLTSSQVNLDLKFTIPPPTISPMVGQQPPPIQNQRSGDSGYQWQPPSLVKMIGEIIGNIFKGIVGIFR